MLPIRAPALKRRPKAADTTGEVLCACLAASTVSLVVQANALMEAFAAVALTI